METNLTSIEDMAREAKGGTMEVTRIIGETGILGEMLDKEIGIAARWEEIGVIMGDGEIGMGRATMLVVEVIMGLTFLLFHQLGKWGKDNNLHYHQVVIEVT